MTLSEQVFRLSRYARHQPWCPESKGPADCTCGLYALLDSIRCTCGHKVSVHTDRDVSDVAGWPCNECRSERCQRFALASTEEPAPTEPEAERQTAWLVERGQSMQQVPTVWYAENEWTTDAREARRFATREDCEAFIDSRSGFAIPSHGDRFGVAVEHVFIGAPTEPEAERGR